MLDLHHSEKLSFHHHFNSSYHRSATRTPEQYIMNITRELKKKWSNICLINCYRMRFRTCMTLLKYERKYYLFFNSNINIIISSVMEQVQYFLTLFSNSFHFTRTVLPQVNKPYGSQMYLLLLKYQVSCRIYYVGLPGLNPHF